MVRISFCQMLRNFRHKLRMIRYYSATRKATAWTRAMDMALIVSLPLALLATWVCDVAVMRKTVPIDLHGQLIRADDSNIVAAVMISDGPSRASIGRPIGNFQFQVEDDLHGWPLTTSVHRRPGRLDLDILSEAKPRQDVRLSADDPLRQAIAQAILEQDEQQALIALNNLDGDSGSSQVRRYWVTTLADAAMWWIMLVLASSFSISMLRFGALIAKGRSSARRAQLRAQGRCIACGYDLRGVEFSERCPECGELIW